MSRFSLGSCRRRHARRGARPAHAVYLKHHVHPAWLAVMSRQALSILLYVLIGTLAVIQTGCGDRATNSSVRTIVDGSSWEAILEQATESTVVWRMWRGDRAINAYVDGWVASRVRSLYGITLVAIEGQGAELVNTLVTERDAGRTGASGTASLMWINGETFGNLRKEGLLFDGWTTMLPNAQWLDQTSPVIGRDFEQDPSGLESPWGTAQFALIYDPARTPQPPHSVPALAAWVRAHPGRFTYDQQFTGMTFLKTIMYALAGGVEAFQGGFTEARYAVGRDRLFAWLGDLRPFLWRGGDVYPPDVAAMHRLFANREIDFTMSNNVAEVVNKAAQGVLPAGARAILLDEGTIANAHYVGIPFNAPNPAGAMVVANFLLSPEAQLEKLRGEVWGDGTVLAVARLPPPFPEQFAAAARHAGLPPPDQLAALARPEVAARYHERLLEDWRARVRRSP
jgi:putative spermidine/putrescine transport system substrate-binding protein